MQAEINIIGIIDTKENGGIDLLNVISQVSALQRQGEIENLIVNIDSLGGDVEIGKSIHAYLKGLKIPVITTVALNQCCSIATIIHLAGNVRKVQSNCSYLIHLPLIDYNGYLNTNEIDSIKTVLTEVEEDLASYYQQVSKIDKNSLLALMRNETLLSPDDLVNFGFAHEIIETKEKQLLNIKAVATNTKINQIINQNQMAKTEFEKKLDSFTTKIKNWLKIKNIMITDVEGKELMVEREEGELAVGDVASPDGTFTLPDGTVIIVANGVIASITPASSEEIDALKTENAALKSELETLQNEFSTFKTEAVSLQNELTELSKLASNYVPQNRKTTTTVIDKGAKPETVASVEENKAAILARKGKK